MRDNLWSYIPYYEYAVKVEGAHDACVYLEVSLVRSVYIHCKMSGTIDHSRIRHKHARENMKVRLGWTNIKHGGQHREA